jgi:uncharacterized protein (DUF885 family)
MRSLALLCLVACGGARTAGPASAFAADADAFYWAYYEHNPKDGVVLGYHQYDGRLPDASPTAMKEWSAAMARAEAKLAAHAPAALSPTERLEREVLLLKIAGERFQLDRLRVPWHVPMLYLDYTLGKLVIEKLRADWMAKTGKSLKAFHDAFLGYACAPLPLIRREMMGEEGRLL